jgi:hypothetical protein
MLGATYIDKIPTGPTRASDVAIRSSPFALVLVLVHVSNFDSSTNRVFY